jgi:Fe-S-cluster containining protein
LALAEARSIAELVEGLPPLRRDAVQARFAAARQRLHQEGLLDPLQSPQPFGPGEPLPQGRAYFSLRLPCPFLEDGACSIYDDRPLACREHLVTSPPENCSAPHHPPVETVELPLDSWCALARTASPREDDRVDWVPLVLAPEWAARRPEPPPDRSGPELLQSFFAELTGRTSREGP